MRRRSCLCSTRTRDVCTCPCKPVPEGRVHSSCRKVCVQVMVVDASNHSGWDPGRDFWRSLRHREKAPPDGLSDCETVRVCPECDGDVGVVEGAPIDGSSDDDLPPLGESSDDDQD